MGGWLTIVVLLAAPTGRPALKLPAPRAVLDAPAPDAPNFVVNISTPTVSFSATDPDLPPVSGSPGSTVTWRVAGNSGRTWNLGLSSAATAFTNCPTVPISAVTVTCTGASAGGGTSTAACSGASTLSTSRTVVASGTEGSGNRSYSITLTYTLTDQWKYIALMSPQCTLTITYNALVN
ncbi:MAG: hypothetical protein LAQ69_40385 [Acidobacteriia bacterium]|nr:hypothetical protein [Terriglobia bacterium]